MDNEANFYKDPSLLIYNLLKDTFKDRYSYFLGMPIEIAQAMYPCIIVQSMQSNNTVTGAPTSTDAVGELIHISFLENTKDDYGVNSDKDTTMRRIYQAIQGRDPATGFYLPGTALFALRTNISLPNGSLNTIIDHDIQVDYDVLGGQDQPTIAHGMITVVTRERIIVPNRV